MDPVIFYTLMIIGLYVLFAIGAFITDVILPKFPKVEDWLEHIIDLLF